jgi:hypothetical protein
VVMTAPGRHPGNVRAGGGRVMTGSCAGGDVLMRLARPGALVEHDRQRGDSQAEDSRNDDFRHPEHRSILTPAFFPTFIVRRASRKEQTIGKQRPPIHWRPATGDLNDQPREGGPTRNAYIILVAAARAPCTLAHRDPLARADEAGVQLYETREPRVVCSIAF